MKFLDLFITHPDMDHMSGIKTLFKKKYVRNFWHVPEDKPDPATGKIPLMTNQIGNSISL